MAGAPARYLVFFQYFGTRYSGVMETKSDQALVGVQNYLEKAAEQLKPSAPIKFHISSRTDSGVHALANAAHLDIQRGPGRAPFTGPQLLQGLNHHLKPEPIRILSAQRVSSTFHARFCALSRTYIYRLLLGCAHRSQIPVFEQDLCWAPPGGALSGLCASQPPGHPSHEGSSPAPAGHPRFQHLPLPAPRGCGPEPREDPAAAAAPAWPRPPGPAPPAQGTGVLGGEGEEQILPIPTGAEDGGRPGGRGPGQAGPGAAAGAAGAQGPPGAAPARHGPAPGALPAQRGVRAERFGPSKCPRRRGALWAEPKGIYNINYKFN
ncbi:tRNA pseudouridine synthase-like 1 isoform X2 [Agelaius phoeniceus]|uniref:tRNA pseudouridine synthase-like 1 isoform X2 n=1 Tax=Agelaius phoeniceus TaxID=39638 RepID=UPI0040552EE7